MASAKKVSRSSWFSVVPVSAGWFEVGAIIGILGCGFALASLAGWHLSDPTLIEPGPGRVENWCGPVGALLADVLYGMVGFGAWAVAAPGALLGLMLAGRDVVHIGRWIAWTCLYITALGALHLTLAPGEGFPAGGAVGWAVAEGLKAAVGVIGAWLTLTGSALILVTWLADIEWGTWFARAVDEIEAWWPKVRGVGTGVGLFVGRILAKMGLGAAGLAWLGVRGAGRQVGRGASGIGGAVRRMGESFTREEDPYPQLARAAATGSSYIEDDADGDVPVSEPTRPGSALAVAEVEWERTQAEVSQKPKKPAKPSKADVALLGMFPDMEPRPTKSDPDVAFKATPVMRPNVSVAAAKLSPVVDKVAVIERPAPVIERPAPIIEKAASVVAPVKPAVKARPTAIPVAVELDDEEEEEDDDLEEDEDEEDDFDDEDLDEDDDEDLDDDEEDEDEEDMDDPASSGADPLDPPKAGKLSRVARGSNVVVHKNKFLDQAAHDDGRSVVQSRTFRLPPLSLLDEVPEQKAQFDEEEMRRLAALVEEKLLTFKIGGRITGIRPGPVVTILEFVPDAGVKVSRIASLADDLAMALRAQKIRIVAPIPGKGAVGIEIPSPQRMTIYLRELMASDEFRAPGKQLPMAIGKDSEGRPTVLDLASTPHVLIGGTTGSGKSVGVNGMLMSMLFTRTPDELRFLLIDPKKLEFEMYHDIPHLLYPIMTEPKEASAALSWACREMDDRYEILARWSVRNIVSYNEKVDRELADWTGEKMRKYAPKGWQEGDGPIAHPAKLPYIVIVIDELADLMMVAGKEVEESICRIAQKARACGIHLIVATQRPSVDVVTGLIKANLPTRIAYTLRSRIDSRTILDEMGAESLLGRGDLLLLPPGNANLVRAHAAFVSDDEVVRLTDHLRAQSEPKYIQEVVAGAKNDDSLGGVGERDELFESAVKICLQLGKASTSLVQRHLKIGYNRAANIIDQMEGAGIIGPADGAKPREVLVSGLD